MKFLGFAFLLLLALCIFSLSAKATNSFGDANDEDEEEDQFFLVLCATVAAIAHHVRKRRNEGVRQEAIIRKRRDVESIMYELGPSYVKRYLRMKPKNFWKLVKVLKPKIEYLRIRQYRKYYRVYRRYRHYRRRYREGVFLFFLVVAAVALAVLLKPEEGGSPSEESSSEEEESSTRRREAGFRLALNFFFSRLVLKERRSEEVRVEFASSSVPVS